jgi:DNA polymerase III epsilon subunit-like protein
MKTYVVCDTETGGLNPLRNALVSVAAIGLDENLNEIGRYYSVVKDTEDKLIEDGALKVNGFTREQILKEGKDVKKVMGMLEKLFENAIPVFHNGPFDAAFLNVRGMRITNCIDTLQIARYKFAGQSARLGDVVQRLGFAVLDAHNSLGDSLMTADVLREFAKTDPSVLKPQPIKFR